MQSVDEYLRADAPLHIRAEKTDLRFQLAMFAAAVKGRSVHMTPTIFCNDVVVEDLDVDYLNQCAAHVYDIFRELIDRMLAQGNRVAKSSEFDNRLLERVEKILSGEMSM